MAVWMNVFGENRLGPYAMDKANQYLELFNSVAMDMTAILDGMIEAGYAKPHIRDFYKTHGESIGKALRAKSDEAYKEYLSTVDHDIERREKEEMQLAADFDTVYKRYLNKEPIPQWTILRVDDKAITLANDLGLTFDQYSGLRISLCNDIIWMSGPSCIMMDYWTFPVTISDKSRNYYHSFFKEILGKFDSGYILYAHEWSGLYADDEDDLTSEELISRLKMDENKSLHKMQTDATIGWFYERI